MSKLLEKVEALPTIAARDTTWLSADDALQVVAQHLYPDGITTEEQFQEVQQAVAAATAELGYGPAETLNPPAVPFDRRGRYHPKIELQTHVLAAVDQLARPGHGLPERRVLMQSLLHNVAKRLGHGRFHDLDNTHRRALTQQVQTILQARGWRITADQKILTKPIPPDEDAARAAVVKHLQQNTGSVFIPRLLRHLSRAAYDGRYYDLNPVPASLQALITAALQACNYQTQPDGDFYHPVMPELPADAAQQLVARFQELTVYQNRDYELAALLEQDVCAAVNAIASFPLTAPFDAWIIDRLIENGPVGAALMQLGYQTVPFTLKTAELEPQTDALTKPTMRFFRKERHFGVRRDVPTVSLARGMRVHAPVIVLDDEAETIIALQIIGPEQSVKANWAALMGGGKTNYIRRTRIKLTGSKSHVTLKQSLPCGWQELWLIHKQASAAEMTPGEPFYVLDDATAVPPSTFFPMLDRAIQLPLQAAWARDLWLLGRQARLITPATDSDSVGRGAWTVHPALDAWSEILSDGLHNGRLAF